jgi:hypothetical protein
MMGRVLKEMGRLIRMKEVSRNVPIVLLPSPSRSSFGSNPALQRLIGECGWTTCASSPSECQFSHGNTAPAIAVFEG